MTRQLESLKSGLDVPDEVAKNRILEYLTARRKPWDAARAICQTRAAFRTEFIIIALYKNRHEEAILLVHSKK